MKGYIFSIEKAAQYDGTGIRTVVFAGCNLRCKWCANPALQGQTNVGTKEYTVDKLAGELTKDKTVYGVDGGVILSGGEPLLQLDFVCDLCDALRAEGVNVWLETSGNIPSSVFQKVLGRCRGVQIDLCHYDNQAHLERTGADMALILANTHAAARSETELTVRLPVIPGFNDGQKDIGHFVALLAALGGRRVRLSPTGGLVAEELHPFSDALRVLGFYVQVDETGEA